MDETIQIIQASAKSPESTFKFEKYLTREGKFDMDEYWLIVIKQLEEKPFFRRFKRDQLREALNNAELRRYKKLDEVLFLYEKVAVVINGSIRIKSQINDVMNPSLIGKYDAGKILGHNESDGGITTASQSWIINFDENTEMIVFDRKDFNRLWSYHYV